MVCLTRPSDARTRRCVEAQARLGFSYPEVAATAGEPPEGYAGAHLRTRHGSGERACAAARAAPRRWGQFQTQWTQIGCPETPVEPGRTVAVLAHVLRVWSLNACRVVYVIDEASRFGFAYGTLPGHAESGEERFQVEHDPVDESVWYDVSAFFRPRQVLARAAWPYLRRKVDQFRRDSAAAMRRAASKATE